MFSSVDQQLQSQNKTWIYKAQNDDDDDPAQQLPPADWTVPAYDDEWQQINVLRANNQLYPEIVSHSRSICR